MAGPAPALVIHDRQMWRRYSDSTSANEAGSLSRLIPGWALTADSLVTVLQS